MSALHIVNTPVWRQRRVTVEELLAQIHPRKLDEREQQIRIARETFPCPPTVRDHDDYLEQLFRFYAQYQRQLYGGDLRQRVGDDIHWRYIAYDHLKRVFNQVDDAERNAITGREGGFIRIVNDVTDGLVKHHIEAYIDLVFFHYLPSDYDLRLRLAEELLKKIGPVLFPGEELRPAWLLAGTIEQVLKAFAMHIHAIRRDWRW